MSNDPLPVINEDIVTTSICPEQENVPAIFARHVGTWQGEYIKTDTRGQFLRSFSGTFTILIDGINYRQVNRYQYSDGTQLQLHFEGEFEGGILKMSSSSYANFSAIAWDAGQETIIFRATKVQDGARITFVETMTLLDQDHRIRSTQSFKDGTFDGILFIEVTRLK